MKSKSEEIASVRWNNHRVFFYALVARILLSFHWVPPRWISYLINNAALRSVVAHPWWTTAYMREYWANQTWETGNECDAKIFAVPILLDNLAPLVLMAVDYAIAHYLYQLASRRDANIRQQEIDLQTKVMPEAIQPPKSLLDILSSIPSYVWPLAYFANPAMILSTAVYGCFVNVKLLCLLVACYHFFTEAGAETKVTARARLSMAVPSVALALAVYLDVSWIVFLLALPEIWDSTLLTYSILQSIHLLTTGGIHGIWIASIGTIRSVPPSLSVLWYTKMELFARFIPSLQIMLGYLPFIVFAPLAMRLNRYPLALVCLFKNFEPIWFYLANVDRLSACRLPFTGCSCIPPVNRFQHLMILLLVSC